MQGISEDIIEGLGISKEDITVLADRYPEEEKVQDVVPSGTSVYEAAMALINGEYGDEEDSRTLLEASDLDYWDVRHMANALQQGYDQVARDVIDNKYGNQAERFRALELSGYDPRLVQSIVNGMLRN